MPAKQWVAQDSGKCENCGDKLFRDGCIPPGGGMIACHRCFTERQRLDEPQTAAEYHAAVGREQIAEAVRRLKINFDFTEKTRRL